jgi:hypothetical protein
MGTSKSNTGLRRNIPLLPDYAPPPEQDESEENNKNPQKPEDDHPAVGNWANAKAALTSATKDGNKTARRGKIARAAKDYVSGSGGASAIRNSSIGGRAVGSKLGRVLFTVIADGIGTALQQQGISDVSGQSTDVVFAQLARQLSSQGGTVEETIANIAVVEALSYIYEEFDLVNKDLVTLDSLTEQQAKDVIQVYVTVYIFERWLHELGTKIENSDLNESQIVELEEEIHDFIRESVKLRFDDIKPSVVDFNRGQEKKIIDEIFKQAYQMIESI